MDKNFLSSIPSSFASYLFEVPPGKANRLGLAIFTMAIYAILYFYLKNRNFPYIENQNAYGLIVNTAVIAVSAIWATLLVIVMKIG